MDRRLEIKMIVTDVDGILTDGGIYIDHRGNKLRRFSALDGIAFVMAHSVGLITAIVSGNDSPEVVKRAEDLGIHEVHLGVRDKLEVVERITKAHDFSMGKICYIGDDLQDLAVMKAAGYAVTVPAAPVELRSAADYVSSRSGGFGAFREVVDHILRNMGLYEASKEHLIG